MKQVSSCFGAWILLLMTTISAVAQTSDRFSTDSQRELRELERQLRISPHHGDLHLERAELLFDMGAWRPAAEGYKMARRHLRGQQVETALAYFKEGICLYLEGEFIDSDYLMSQAIQEMPEAPHAWYFRGKTRLLYLDAEEEGSRDLEKSLDLAESISVQTFIARYLIGEFDGAFQEYEKLTSIAREEENQSALASLSYQLATLYGITGNTERAVVQLRQAFDAGFQGDRWFSWDPSFMPIADEDLFHQLLQSLDIRYYHRRQAAFTPQGTAPSRPSSAESISRGGSSYSFQRGDLKWGVPSLLDEDQNSILSAGEEAILEVPLLNRSGISERFTAKIAVPDSLIPYLQFRRLDRLQSIPVGDSIVMSWSIQAAPSLSATRIPVTIEVQPNQGWGPAPLEVSFQSMAYQTISLEIPDHHFASEYGGNMEAGVPVLFTFAVQNTGDIPAKGVTVSLPLPEGVFSTKGDAFVLGQMDPGQAEIIEFEFFTQRDYPRPRVTLPVKVEAEDGAWSLVDTFQVRMESPLELTEQVVIRPRPRKVEPEVITLSSSVDKNLPVTRNVADDAIAIVIGNRDYSHPDVPVVDYALKDAASMRRYLIEVFGFKEENVIFLTNASQADFYGLFGTNDDHRARLFNMVSPGETDVFVYYSGHGAPDPETQTGYFLPVDCDPTLVRFNGYPLSTFYRNLSQTPYRTLTVVLDACFSGNSEQGSLIQQASPVRIKTDNPILRDPNAWVLSAAASDQIASWNRDESHGLFTWLVLQAFQGAADVNRDQQLSYEEVRRYLSAEVPQQARRLHNRYQTPDIYGLDSRILLRYD